MKRFGLLSSVILAAMLAVACGSGDDASPAPTGPTPSTPPPATPPPPQNSCAPPPVTGLAVTQTGSSTRVFTWNASPGATDYFIQIGTSSGSGDMIYTNTSQTTYTWTGQSVSSLFYYARVHARNACGQANPSNEIVFH